MRARRMRRSRVRQLSGLSVNRMIPNVLTLLALCAGMTAIRFAIDGNFQAAVFSIIAAGVFDGLDGRIARLLKSTSRFGAELDSLSDFVSFGVAPAAILYLWTMAALGSPARLAEHLHHQPPADDDGIAEHHQDRQPVRQ